MKTFFKHLFSIFILAVVFSSQADQLETEKGKLLLDNIREDISSTLSLVADIESEQDWTVYLSQTNGRLVRVGLVVEPSTRTVLSVAADGVARSMGLLTGDIIETVTVNGQRFRGNLSSAQFTHGDDLKISVIRNANRVELEQQIESSFIPNWQLYSSSTAPLGTTLKSADPEKLTMSLRSEQSKALLRKLESRINYTLSEIYKLESKERKELRLNLSKVARVSTELGVSLDEDHQVLSIKEASNAEHLGVQTGDFLRGYRSNAGESFDRNIASLKLQPHKNISLKIDRKGQTIVLSGDVKPTVNPSWSMSVSNELKYNEETCGVITTLADPPAGWHFFKAYISEVNGNRIKNNGLAYKLPAGLNRIKLHEAIPASEHSMSLSRKKNFTYSNAKVVEFLIQPNKRYYLGSKLIKSKRYKNRTGEYWEPYVWKVEDYECSLDD